MLDVLKDTSGKYVVISQICSVEVNYHEMELTALRTPWWTLDCVLANGNLHTLFKGTFDECESKRAEFVNIKQL